MFFDSYDLLGLLFLGVVAWFWLDSLRNRDLARGLCKKICQENRVRLLDDTVVLVRLGLARNTRGRLCWQRTYQFEFQVQNDDSRYLGRLILKGSRLSLVELPDVVNRTIYSE